MQRLAVFYHPDVLTHATGSGFFEAAASPVLAMAETHPENAERLQNMLSVLERGPIADALDWFEAEVATREDLERFHASAYIDELADIPLDETRWFSGTTVFGPGSYQACVRAAGLTLAAAQSVYAGRVPVAYALVRPPGHHVRPVPLSPLWRFHAPFGVRLLPQLSVNNRFPWASP